MAYKISPIPRGMFSDSTTQTFASTTAAYAVTFNTDEIKLGITHSTSVNPSRIYVDTSGDYLVTFSACLGLTSGTNQYVEVWAALDGTAIARSNTWFTINSASAHPVMTVTFILQMNKDQYFELYTRASSTNCQIVATGVGTNPTRPATPSVILTINKVSK